MNPGLSMLALDVARARHEEDIRRAAEKQAIAQAMRAGAQRGGARQWIGALLVALGERIQGCQLQEGTAEAFVPPILRVAR